MLKKIYLKLLHVQKFHPLGLSLLFVVWAILASPRAIHLLTAIKTDIIHLLPNDYQTVGLTDVIQKKFDRRSSLYIVLSANKATDSLQQAMLELKDFLLLSPDVGYIESEKPGYDFLNSRSLLLMDLADVYRLKDDLTELVSKKKLGPLYVEFGDGPSPEERLDNLSNKYTAQLASGVKNKYFASNDGKVITLNIYPSDPNSSIAFFKIFCAKMEQQLAQFELAKKFPQIKAGFVGTVRTRVDQYDALMQDIKFAGLVSLAAIFILLYIHFYQQVGHSGGRLKKFNCFYRLVPVLLIFIPMILATLIGFWFCSFFFDSLNLVTSFLFSILFGLGVDIGIHLITRFMQDKLLGTSDEEIHHNLLVKTGKSCLIGILTTVASFYILSINDFRGFSDFGYIAGNGLFITLVTYLLLFPSLLLWISKLGLFPLKISSQIQTRLNPNRPHWFKRGKLYFSVLLALAIFCGATLNHVQFEWDFHKLKMKFKEREATRQLLLTTHGRVNSAASYIVKNEVEARKIGQELQSRAFTLADTSIQQFYRSYYDLTPLDQPEKLALINDIESLLNDSSLELASETEIKSLNQLREQIILAKDNKDLPVPPELKQVFFGKKNISEVSIAFAMPHPQKELDNGNNAKAFYNEVGIVQAFGQMFYAVSDSIIFAQVLTALFKDTKMAIGLSSLMLILLTWLDFRDFKRTALVFFSLSCGLFWMFGLMAIFDIRLNFYNMIIIPAMIGMGEDISIHVVHRFEEFGRTSILDVLRSSGRASLTASLTTIFGYGGMCLTSHPGLTSIGWMAVIGMGTCLFASLVFLPLCLQIFMARQDLPIVCQSKTNSLNKS